jgi:hypothetical protein
MDNLALWHLMRAVWRAMNPHFEPAIQEVMADAQLEPRAWGLLLAAQNFEPEEVTPGHLLVRSPYTSAEYYLYQLKSITSAGLMAEVNPGKFRLTATGRQAVQRFIDRARFAMAQADPLPPADSNRLADMVEKLVESSLNHPAPPNPWSIQLSYHIMPGKNPPLPFIEQAFTCLDAYRDDAHLAAWRDSNLSATAFETLTLLWSGEADALNEIVRKLARRGHDPKVYTMALSELRSYGYVAGARTALRLSPTGQTYRDQVESKTNELFFQPWEVLSENQKNELEELLNRLHTGLAQSN